MCRLGQRIGILGFDLQRTGYNPFESTVGPNNVSSLQKLWSVNVGYAMVH